MNRMSSPHQESFPPTADLLRSLVDKKSQVIYGDEAPGQKIGRGRELMIGASLVHATIYSRNRRRYMAGILEPIIGKSHGLPLGHLEFSAGGDGVGEPAITGAVYALRRANMLDVRIAHDVEETMSGEAFPSFELARALGIGDTWTQTGFNYVADEKLQTQSMARPLEELETAKLNQTLVRLLTGARP